MRATRERRATVVPPGPAAEAADEARPRRLSVRDVGSLRGGDILTLLRSLDIPCSIDSFSAQGWTAKLGDPSKGFYAQQGRFATLDAAARWLLEEARRHYPDAIPDAT